MEEQEAPKINPYDKHQDQNEKIDHWRAGAEIVKTFLFVAVLTIILRVFVIQPFVVEGSSMSPKFHTNDYLIVDKLSYRLHQPNRGDIVVFKYPLNPTVDYIKRVIGLPGETVRIENGKIYIINSQNPNGFLLQEDYISKEINTSFPSKEARVDTVVPKDQYFVLGDNRPGSSDSREWGTLPNKDLIGRVVFQAYPWQNLQFINGADYKTN